MGAWGTGIYSNDTAGDVRDACKDIFGYYDVEEGNQKDVYKRQGPISRTARKTACIRTR